MNIRVPQVEQYGDEHQAAIVSGLTLTAVLSFVAIVGVTGCATTPKPQPLATANIAVVAACVDEGSIDPLPDTAMPARTAGPDALAAGAAADLLRYRELARRQQEMLRACAKLK